MIEPGRGPQGEATISTPVLNPSTDTARFARLEALLAQVAATNEFQRERLDGLELRSLDDLSRIALTSKDALVADQAAHPPFGTNLTFERERYLHVHQTSGTSGATLRVLDTAEDWQWWRRCFATVFTAAGVGEGDVVALAHSFGPYIQFWASYEGAGEVGAMVVALGGMDSVQRLETIREYGATTLVCTPSYAVHLAKVAAQGDRLGLARVRGASCSARASPAPRSPACGPRSSGSGTRAASTMPGSPRSGRSATRAPMPAACT